MLYDGLKTLIKKINARSLTLLRFALCTGSVWSNNTQTCVNTVTAVIQSLAKTILSWKTA